MVVVVVVVVVVVAVGSGNFYSSSSHHSVSSTLFVVCLRHVLLWMIWHPGLSIHFCVSNSLSLPQFIYMFYLLTYVC